MASKTYRTSAGITIGGLRIAVAVHGYPTRKVTIKVGNFTAYTADWNEQSRATATGIIASMLGEGELGHCPVYRAACFDERVVVGDVTI